MGSAVSCCFYMYLYVFLLPFNFCSIFLIFTHNHVLCVCVCLCVNVCLCFVMYASMYAILGSHFQDLYVFRVYCAINFLNCK